MKLNNTFKWFNVNKLSLNKNRTKYTLFHKTHEKEKNSLKIPSLFTSDRKIKQITSIKILGVLIDEHVTKKELITVIENKVSKKCRLPIQTQKVTGYCGIKNYLNYENIVRKSREKLKKLRVIKNKH